MNSNDITKMIAAHGLISDQVDSRELAIILQRLVDATSRSDGAVVEFGCYRGTTSLYIRRALDALKDMREFHVYDSFEGLPVKSEQDRSPVGEQFKEGELRVSKKDFVREFASAHLRIPVVHKGWFDQLDAADIPSPIAFAFLDGDYYDSVKMPLRLIQDKLAPGAIVIVDDYANEALPGAARAVDEWARAKGLSVTPIRSLAVMKMPD